MATATRAVELARSVRAKAGLRTRQPLAKMWLALPEGEFLGAELLALVAQELNVEAVELVGDESALLEWRVKPLLPKLGQKLKDARYDLAGQNLSGVAAVMAATKAGAYERRADGSATMAGLTLAPDEHEVQASARPGTAVGQDEGLAVVLDTTLTPLLRARGDARELARAVQDARKEAGAPLDAEVTVYLEAADEVVESLSPYLAEVGLETRSYLEFGAVPNSAVSLELDAGRLRLSLVGELG
jgi:isoleucyl-tRNA synthetase